MKRIVLDIDQLVLNGLRFEARDALADSLRMALSRQLANPGLPAISDLEATSSD